MKKIPMRSCVVTKEKLPKRELLRIVKNNENKVFVDLTGKANGRVLSLLKKGEVYAAVDALFHKVGMGREIVFLAMLQDEESSFTQHVLFKNQVGQCRQLGQFVRRVGKDQVKSAPAASDVFEYIAMNR